MANWDASHLAAALAEEAWEPRAARQVQRKLADMRNALRTADARWRTARMDTNPDQSLHLLDIYDDVPIGLGDRMVYMRPNLLDLGREDHFQVRIDKDRELLLVTYVGPWNMVVRPQSGNVIAVGRSA